MGNACGREGAGKGSNVTAPISAPVVVVHESACSHVWASTPTTATGVVPGGNNSIADAVPEVVYKGITLHALRKLWQHITVWHAEHGERLFGEGHKLEELTSTQLVQSWVKPFTHPTLCRLCEMQEVVAPEEVRVSI